MVALPDALVQHLSDNVKPLLQTLTSFSKLDVSDETANGGDVASLCKRPEGSGVEVLSYPVKAVSEIVEGVLPLAGEVRDQVLLVNDCLIALDCGTGLRRKDGDDVIGLLVTEVVEGRLLGGEAGDTVDERDVGARVDVRECPVKDLLRVVEMGSLRKWAPNESSIDGWKARWCGKKRLAPRDDGFWVERSVEELLTAAIGLLLLVEESVDLFPNGQMCEVGVGVEVFSKLHGERGSGWA